jgi:hypothetical protein
MVYHHTNLVVCGGLQTIITNDSFDFYFTICLYPVDCVLTFLTASSLVFFFHYLARKNKIAASNIEKDQEQVKVRNNVQPFTQQTDPSTLYFKEGFHEWKRLVNQPQMATEQSIGAASGVPYVQPASVVTLGGFRDHEHLESQPINEEVNEEEPC